MEELEQRLLRSKEVSGAPKATPSKSGIMLLKSLCAFLILPNLVLVLISQFVYMMRPVFNLDYLLLGMVAPLFSPSISILAIGLLFGNDLIVNLAPLFHFQFGDVFYSLKDILLLNPVFSIPGVMAFFVLIGVISFASTRLSRTAKFVPWKNAALLFSLCSLLAWIKIINGTAFVQIENPISFLNVNIAYSGVKRSYESRGAGQTTLVGYEPLENRSFASQPIFAAGKSLRHSNSQANSQANSHFVLVLVESLGAFKDPALAAKLLEPFSRSEVGKAYQVKIGEVPFEGNTIHGEARELCGVRLLSLGDMSSLNCLPKTFHQAGYETTGIHGFSNQFYNRYRWYPTLGFDRILFAQDLYQEGLRKKCGSAFTGICDTEVIEWIHHRLKRPSQSPQFIYWLTLNSHLPLDFDSAKESSFDCKLFEATSSSVAICQHTRMVHLVLERLAQVAMDPTLPPTEFLLVGDHMPPFVKPVDRLLYLQGKVPSIRLIPRPR